MDWEEWGESEKEEEVRASEEDWEVTSFERSTGG